MKTEKKSAPVLKFAKPPHVAIVEARFYDHLNDLMLDGAKAALEKSGATFEIITVPGAMEIPAAVQFLSQRKTGKPFDAFIALGCVIRGATSHYDIVCTESTRGLTDVALKHNLAVGNCILTIENEAQALERADKNQMDKAGGAALAALMMLQLKQNCGI